MKTSTFFASILCCLLALHTHAQLNNLPNDSAVWTVKYSFLLFPDSSQDKLEFHHMTGDTVISGKQYAKLVMCSSPHYNKTNPDYSQPYAFLRETAGGFVYIRRAGDTTEFALYNFNLNPGDTFVAPPIHLNSAQSVRCSLVVQQVDSFLVHGQYHKRIQLTETGGSFCWGRPHRWVQGIGDYGDGLLYMNLWQFDWNVRMVCLWEKGNYLYDGGCIHTGVSEVKGFDVPFTYPNPFADCIRMKIPEQPERVQLASAATGQIIPADWNISNKTLTIGNLAYLPVGLYLVQVTTKTGVLITSKAIKEKQVR